MPSFIPSTIRRYRNQRHLTLEDVSGVAGMSVQHLSEIEPKNRSYPPPARAAGGVGKMV